MILFLFRAVVAHVCGPHCAYPSLAAESVRQAIEDELA